jgi:hypothetical protein
MSYRVERITIETPPGIGLETMMRKVCLAALEHGCIAEFVHNDRRFAVSPADIIACVEQK